MQPRRTRSQPWAPPASTCTMSTPICGVVLLDCSQRPLTGHSPVGNKFDAKPGLDVAGFLQQVAWETVRSYYAK